MRRSRGSVLIVVLWAVIFFSLVAVTLGVKARTQLGGLGRFIQITRAKPMAYSGISYAIECWRQEKCDAVREISLPSGSFKIEILDEESKINLNTAPEGALTAIFMSEDKGMERAQQLARGVSAWRQRREEFAEFGHRLGEQGAGFGSVGELLVVPGMTEELWTKIKDSLTVYGRDKVNMNSVSRETLVLLGLDAALAKRITDTRTELSDGAPWKPGQVIFSDLNDLTQKVGVSPHENGQLQNLGSLWGFDSQTLRVLSTGAPKNTGASAAAVEFVLDKKARILYLKDM